MQELDPEGPESGKRLLQVDLRVAAIRITNATTLPAVSNKCCLRVCPPLCFFFANNMCVEAPPLSYQFRIATLKILIEVGDAKHAIALAKQLMLEDDDNVEIWCVAGS